MNQPEYDRGPDSAAERTSTHPRRVATAGRSAVVMARADDKLAAADRASAHPRSVADVMRQLLEAA